MRDTPARMARAYAEMFTPPAFELTTFPKDEQYDELLVARSIPMQSVCEHHLLPFTGALMPATSPTGASSVCPSWRVWTRCSPDGRRSKNA